MQIRNVFDVVYHIISMEKEPFILNLKCLKLKTNNNSYAYIAILTVKKYLS